MHSTDKSLAELGDKVPAADKSAIESATADLKGALNGEDREQILRKTEALARAAMKIGDAMYKQSGGATGGVSGAGEDEGHGGDAGVVDAEFEEVRDDDGKKKSA